MKTSVSFSGAIYALSISLFFASCQKSDLTPSTATTDSSSIAVAATATTASGSRSASTDSVYLMQSCGSGGSRDSISQLALPSIVQSYTTTNYSGATFSKAFAIKNGSAAVTGYVAVIYYNNKPVGLLFDSEGAFLRVLEQREKGNPNGSGHHNGSRFEHRDGKGRDTIALSALPSAVTAYFVSNYASDTLVKAFRGKDSSLVVLSKNSGLFATVFNWSNAFVERKQLPSGGTSHQSIDLLQLPSVAANYLLETYPNYVFEKAFSFSQNGALKGYVIIIDANNTKYAIVFDASGNFIRVKPIH